MPHPRFSGEEIARRGEELYEQHIRRPLQSEENIGKILSTDIETANHEIGDDPVTTSRSLQARHPDAAIWTRRIGYNVVYALGGTRTRTASFCLCLMAFCLIMPAGIAGAGRLTRRGSGASERTSIQEAVLRSLLSKYEKDAGGEREVWFVEVGRHDPPPALLRRLRSRRWNGGKWKLEPVSRATTVRKRRFSHVDRRTGQKGVVLRVADELKRLPGGEVEVQGGYHTDGLNAEGDVYRLARTRGRWRVVHVERKWVS
jgi:hypothetical protein